jgi:HEAT repeat protein
LAAEVLGYAPDKAAVIDDLVHGMSDPSEAVRNNAMRALMVIAEMAPGAGRQTPRIPPQPFIALLNSPVWSDRNKSSAALSSLTRSRDARLLDALRQPEAIGALAEMARWKNEGHAQAAFLILARIAGYPDQDALTLWQRGDREVAIRAAISRK